MQYHYIVYKNYHNINSGRKKREIYVHQVGEREMRQKSVSLPPKVRELASL